MKPFHQMTYFELTRYTNELSSEIWYLAKALEEYRELHDCELYAVTLKNTAFMIDTISKCLNA